MDDPPDRGYSRAPELRDLAALCRSLKRENVRRLRVETKRIAWVSMNERGEAITSSERPVSRRESTCSATGSTRRFIKSVRFVP
jgi:hypothetical protein